MSETRRPVCLSIAGLDPSGGAGIIADVKTFSAFGCYAAAAVTSVTFQNTTGVFGPSISRPRRFDGRSRQFSMILTCRRSRPACCRRPEIIEAVAEMIIERELPNIVIDPVIRSTSGYELIDDGRFAILIEKSVPPRNTRHAKYSRGRADHGHRDRIRRGYPGCGGDHAGNGCEECADQRRTPCQCGMRNAECGIRKDTGGRSPVYRRRISHILIRVHRDDRDARHGMCSVIGDRSEPCSGQNAARGGSELQRNS